MKKINSIIAIIAVSIAISSSASAQETASATSSSTVITPISITKNIEMNFGNIAVSSTAGTVILAPDNTRTKTDGVTLPQTEGTVSAAKFTVNGQADFMYDITLPSTDLTLTETAGQSETMVVNAFTSTPGETAGVLTNGSEEVFVGATLNVNATQLAGTYTNATGFNVTVNYN